MPAAARALPLLLACLALPVVLARPAPAQPPRNGYPELLQAAELLKQSKHLAAASAPRASLEAQRLALAEPPVKRALQLLDGALSRPVVTPPPAQDVEQILKQSSAARSLSRLLRVRHYVLLSQGRTRDAVLTARTGLRVGRIAQGELMISGLTGLAISTGAIVSLGEHLDQLPLADCNLLSEVCLEWLNQPDPLVRVLEGERRFGLRRLEQQLKPLEGGAHTLADTQRELDALYARLFEELRKPPWARSRLEAPAGDTLAAATVRLLAPSFNALLDGYTREMARVRLLACHAAIRRFRWEQNRLPITLEEARLGGLAIDPFTGKELQYAATGSRTYRLTSAGPEARPDDPKGVEGRVPVSVTPD